MKRLLLTSCVLALVAGLGTARAEGLKIGATLSVTGPAASIGIPMKNTFQILPKEIEGVPVEWTILDDATDTTSARRNAEKLAADDVDVIIGGNTTPTALATVELAGQAKVPVVAIGPSASIIEPVEGARTWVFKAPLGERELGERTLRDMEAKGIRNFGFIGFNDAFGEAWLSVFHAVGERRGITMAATEKFARSDNSVVAQVLKVLATSPQAVFVAATSTPAALPIRTLRERGYKGPIYSTSGVLNADFLRVGGKAVEGVRVAGGALVVAAGLSDDNPSKAVGLEFTRLYDGAYGAGSTSFFAGNAYDAWLLIRTSVAQALGKAKPGTPEFRAALRDAMEGTSHLAVTSGVMNMRKTDHGGYTADSPVLLVVQDGAWALAK